MKIAIIGAGIAGTLSAFYLARKGAEVTVLEKNSGPAAAASGMNGGQLSYSSVAPLGSLTLLKKMPSVLGGLDRDIKIECRSDSTFWWWGAHLFFQCFPKPYARNKEVLRRLAFESGQLMQDFRREYDFDFGYGNAGKLYLYPSKRDLEKAAAGVPEDVEKRALSPEECLHFEPSLKQREGPLAGGLFFPHDRSGDCRKFTASLADILKRDFGADFQYGVQAKEFVYDQSRAVSLITDRGEIVADCFLLCAGADIGHLGKYLGLSVPVYPMKGFSADAHVEKSGDLPLRNVTDHYRKMVFGFLGESFRIAGFARFSGYNTEITDAEYEFFEKRAREAFPDLQLKRESFASGLRPYTPNSIPMVGKTCKSNVYVNMGHGMYGWTLSHATCQKVSDIIHKNETNN